MLGKDRLLCELRRTMDESSNTRRAHLGLLCSCGYFVGGHSSFTFRKSSALLSIGNRVYCCSLGTVSWWMSQAVSGGLRAKRQLPIKWSAIIDG